MYMRKKGRVALFAGVILAIFISNFMPFYAACQEVREDTLRLHILANSDSEEDQALKLKVRDAILEHEADFLGTAVNKEQAVSLAGSQIAAIQSIAQQVVYDNGYQYPVTAQIENMYFDTRMYDDFTLPAGRYDALRVEIGSHEGKNWFCVLFPPLCVPSAMPEEVSYTQEEKNAIYSPYEIKFAAVELIEQIWKAE